MSQKTLTCVLFNKKKEFEAFGYAAEDKYAEVAIDQKDKLKDYYLFRRFKMALFDRMVRRMIDDFRINYVLM